MKVKELIELKEKILRYYIECLKEGQYSISDDFIKILKIISCDIEMREGEEE